MIARAFVFLFAALFTLSLPAAPTEAAPLLIAKGKAEKKRAKAQAAVDKLLAEGDAAGDDAAATELYEQALEAARKLNSEMPLDQAVQCEPLIRLGKAGWLSGSYKAAENRLSEALGFAEQAAREQRGEARWLDLQVAALLPLADIHARRGKPDQTAAELQQALEAQRKAVDLASSDARRRTLVKVLVKVSDLRAAQSKSEAAAELIDEALVLLVTLPAGPETEALRVKALAEKTDQQLRAGKRTDATASAEQAVTAARGIAELKDGKYLIKALAARSRAYSENGELSKAAADLAEALTLAEARARSNPSNRPAAQAVARLLTLQGDANGELGKHKEAWDQLSRAETKLEALLEGNKDSLVAKDLAVLHRAMGKAALRMGDLDTAVTKLRGACESLLREGRGAAAGQVDLLLCRVELGEVLLARREMDEAGALFNTMLDEVRAQAAENPDNAGFGKDLEALIMTMQARVDVSAMRYEAAQTKAAEARELAERDSTRIMALEVLAAAQAMDNPEESANTQASAVELHRGQEPVDRPRLAQLLRRLGTYHQSAFNDDDALAALEEARNIYAELLEADAGNPSLKMRLIDTLDGLVTAYSGSRRDKDARAALSEARILLDSISDLKGDPVFGPEIERLKGNLELSAMILE